MNPSTDWKEQIPPGEAEHLEALGARLHALQKKNAKGRPGWRALHTKATLTAEARFEVLPELPAHARAGLFAEPRSYHALVRFSNGAGARQKDRVKDVRGIAVKVLGVSGKKVIPGLESATTQDFLAVRSPSLPIRTPDEFIELVHAVRAPLTGFPKFIGKFGFGRTVQILKRAMADLNAPMDSLATTRFFSAAPIRFGAHAVKFSFTPHAKPTGAAFPASLGDELAARLRAGPVTYDFQVQFFVDEKVTPIEDPTITWPEAESPFFTVARLTLGQQDASAERGQQLTAYAETLSFDPWHAQEELRPLGAIMRARNPAYRLSTQERAAAPEPTGEVPEVPRAAAS